MAPAGDRQHVELVRRVRQPDARAADAGERLHGDDHDHVGDEQQHRRDDARPARRAGLVRGLLVDRQGGVPAPVDEQHQHDPGHERRDGQVGGQQPAEAHVQRPGRRVTAEHPDEGRDRHDQQHDELDGQQRLLEVGRDLDAAVADIGHRGDPQDPDQQHPAAGGVAADRAVRALDEEEHVLPGHLGQAGHDQDVGRQDGPAAGPAGFRPERPRGPDEGGPAVGIGLVQLAEADRAQEHRHERQHGDERGFQPDGADHEKQRRGQAVGRGGRGHADDHAGHQAQGAGLEPLGPGLLAGQQVRTKGGHGSPSCQSPHGAAKRPAVPRIAQVTAAASGFSGYYGARLDRW